MDEQDVPQRADLGGQGYTVAPLGGGDYVVRVRHASSGDVRVQAGPGGPPPPPPEATAPLVPGGSDAGGRAGAPGASG